MTESYFSEEITWPRFIKVCSQEMRLQGDSVPEFSWKFSNGTGSKIWTTLSGSSYLRMMEAAAKRIRARAKKESGLKDSDLGSGWRIDLRLENKVRTVEKENYSDEDEAASTEEKKKKKKKTKESKGKARTKRKRDKPTKVFCPSLV